MDHQNYGLSCAQVRHFKSAFSKFDADHDGVISSRELGQVLRFIGHNPTEAEIQVTMIVDTDIALQANTDHCRS